MFGRGRVEGGVMDMTATPAGGNAEIAIVAGVVGIPAQPDVTGGNASSLEQSFPGV